MMPFDPQPLTPAQQQQVDDQATARVLITGTLAALTKTKADFSEAKAESSRLTGIAQVYPAIEVDVEELLKAEENYVRLQDLVRNVGYYLGGVQGWRDNIGQPSHETKAALLERLKSSWPDAAAAVGAN